MVSPSTGEILYTIVSIEPTYTSGEIYNNTLCFLLPKELEAIDDVQLMNSYFFKNGQLLPKSERPSDYHTWDSAEEQWIISTSTLFTLQTGLISSIKLLRDAKDDEDLVYDGSPYQVAVKDRENITGKIAVLKAEIELNLPEDVSTYFWRDSNNSIRTWGNRLYYLSWLQGLTIAYGNRRSSIYVRSWQHGAAIKAIIESEDSNEEKLASLLAYDITTGW